jgi:hypothetical protein
MTQQSIPADMIRIYDARIIENNNIVYRQKAYPENHDRSGKYYIEHRNIISKFWDVACSDEMHSQACWDSILKEGKVIS